MAKRRHGRQSKNGSDTWLKDLMGRLSANFSQDEIREIVGRSLLARNPAGIERMAAGLDTETAAAVRKALRSGTSKKPKTSRPTISKTRQEWDSAWRDWDAYISETAEQTLVVGVVKEGYPIGKDILVVPPSEAALRSAQGFPPITHIW